MILESLINSICMRFTHYNKGLLIHLIVISLTFYACQKDKLIDELEVFKGKYSWTHSVYKQNWWNTGFKTKYASNSEYTAEIEFNDEGKILFYINGEMIHKTGFSIETKELSNAGKTIYLAVDPYKEDSEALDMNDIIDFNLTADTLIVNDFPGAGYDNLFSGGNYFIRN